MEYREIGMRYPLLFLGLFLLRSGMGLLFLLALSLVMFFGFFEFHSLFTSNLFLSFQPYGRFDQTFTQLCPGQGLD